MNQDRDRSRSVALEGAEHALAHDVKNKLDEISAAFRGFPTEGTDTHKLLREMGQKAHELHIALKVRALEPKHHAYMLKNRELPADDEEFYMHVHPVEDLLRFIEDTSANDDPEDQTIGHEFTLSVYSRRWGHNDTYGLTRIETGWDVNLTHSGPCDKAGRPFLYSNFDNDLVHYPAGIGGYLEWLWVRASEQGLSHEAVQEALDQLAEWINVTSHNAPPRDGVWESY